MSIYRSIPGYHNRDYYVIGALYLLTEILVTVNAKYCLLEISGEQKYYICPKNEYCCNFGCCINPAFQFYQLWYYWLLIIFVFLACSGGGWWLKYCRNGNNSVVPPNSTENRFGFRSTPIVSANSNVYRNYSERSRLGRYARCPTNRIHDQTAQRSNAGRVGRGPHQGFDNMPTEYDSTGRHCRDPHGVGEMRNVLGFENRSLRDSDPRTAHFIYSQSDRDVHNDYDDIDSEYERANDPKPPKYENPYYEIYGPPPSYESVINLHSASTFVRPYTVASQNNSTVHLNSNDDTTVINVHPNDNRHTVLRLYNSSTVPENLNYNDSDTDEAKGDGNKTVENNKRQFRIFQNPLERLGKIKRNKSCDTIVFQQHSNVAQELSNNSTDVHDSVQVNLNAVEQLDDNNMPQHSSSEAQQSSSLETIK